MKKIVQSEISEKCFFRVEKKNVQKKSWKPKEVEILERENEWKCLIYQETRKLMMTKVIGQKKDSIIKEHKYFCGGTKMIFFLTCVV